MKLVYYHPIAIHNKHPFQSVVNPLISVMDRTTHIWPNYDYLMLYPMPKLADTFVDFNSISNNRLQQICEHTGHITVLWSGGIDSTYIMCLMIQSGLMSKLHREERLTIGLNEDSIRENPVFYDKFIKPNYMNCVIQADRVLKYPTDNNIIITGEMADNLVGSLTMKSCVDYYNKFSIVHEKWGKAVDFLGRKLSEGQRSILRDFIDDAVSRSPVEIRSNHDLMWYLNFNYKWQAVNFRIVSHCDSQDNGNMLIKNLVHFFNTDDFQQWSMHEGHYFTGTSWTQYKMPLKRLIHTVTGDDDYFAHKTKYPSLPGLLRYRDTYDFIYYNSNTDKYIFTKEML